MTTVYRLEKEADSSASNEGLPPQASPPSQDDIIAEKLAAIDVEMKDCEGRIKLLKAKSKAKSLQKSIDKKKKRKHLSPDGQEVIPVTGCGKCRLHQQLNLAQVSETDASESDADLSSLKPKQKKQKKEAASLHRTCRAKNLFTRNQMLELVEPETFAYRMSPEDLLCPRQFRLFCNTARSRPDCRADIYQNKVVRVRDLQGGFHELPLNGRSSERFTGAVEKRGRTLLTKTKALKLESNTVSFMKECGFGSLVARGLIDEVYHGKPYTTPPKETKKQKKQRKEEEDKAKKNQEEKAVTHNRSCVLF